MKSLIQSKKLVMFVKLPSHLKFASTHKKSSTFPLAKMGTSCDSMHKRSATGGKKKAWRKTRKYEPGRQPENKKISSNKTVRVKRIRVHGGNVKWRALMLDTGNYS